MEPKNTAKIIKEVKVELDKAHLLYRHRLIFLTQQRLDELQEQNKAKPTKEYRG